MTKKNLQNEIKQGLNRRQFIQKAGSAAGAALVFPHIVPSTVFGATAPSNRVHVGLIGCGGISNYHTNYLKQMEDVRVIAVCDAYKSRRLAKAADLTQHYGGSDIVKAHADFREILDRPDVDAVIVAAHDNWHTPMSIAAAKAGKDVYCQKPLSLDLGQTRILRKVVNDNKRVFQFGTQYRSMARYRKMVELVRNGYIGELKQIDVWCRNVRYNAESYHVKPYGSTVEVPIPDDLDFDAWQGPAPLVPYTVDRATSWGGYHCPETSLGFLAGCGIHPLGIAQWGNHSDHTSPIRYEGTGSVPKEGIFRTLERWDVLCNYENGVTLRVMDYQTARDVVTKYYPAFQDDDGVVFHGTEGWIGNFDQGGTFDASNPKLWKQEFRPDEETLLISPEHNRNFIDCVKSRQETICPVEMAIRCDTICHLVDAAAQTGRTIQWDPKAEQIIGDEEAAKMLTRVYREKWKVW
ncbi:MAG: Inositol 2-dehydrogenase [Planctomycetes bacterium ADurb.Bin412]|nr:MAG: Inositol 2-dehydrogenase [Planctomycetes bacterium ADurb.Bin412]